METTTCTTCQIKGKVTVHFTNEVCPICFPPWKDTGFPVGSSINREILESESENLLERLKKLKK
jgi:hypothetical protein